MKSLVAVLAAIGLLAVPSSFVSVTQAATEAALACPADAPEGWKRPGGYCEQRNSLDTIGTEKGNGVAACRDFADLGPAAGQPLLRRLVVADVDPCCFRASAAPLVRLPDGMLSRSDETVLVSVC